MDKVVDLINSAKVEAKEQKIHLLAQASCHTCREKHRVQSVNQTPRWV